VSFLDHHFWGELAYAYESSRWTGQAPSGRPVVGAVGQQFLRQYRFAFDGSSRTIAFATGGVEPLDAAGAVLPLMSIPTCRAALTAAVRLPTRKDAPEPVLLLDTGSDRCALTQSFLIDHMQLRAVCRGILPALAARLRGRRTGFAFVVSLPPETVATAVFTAISSMQAYAKRLGLTRIDGWLGMTFFRHWCCVFDYAHAQVILLDRSAPPCEA
jgi:hypothetical protein